MDTERAVLRSLAAAGIADADTVTAAVDPEVDPATVETTLDSLADEGHVEADAGFYYLTDAGEDRLTTLLQERFAPEEREQLREALEDFERLDDRMKTLASEWQSLDVADRDAAGTETVESLAALHADLEDWLDGLDGALGAAYAHYAESLAEALAAIRDGQAAYFTGTEVDSYHEVWFDLHDDLLRTLGEDR